MFRFDEHWSKVYPSLVSYKAKIDQQMEPRVPTSEVDWVKEGQNYDLIQKWLEKCNQDGEKIINTRNNILHGAHLVDFFQVFDDTCEEYFSKQEWIGALQGEEQPDAKQVPDWKECIMEDEFTLKENLMYYSMQLEIPEGSKVHVWGDIHGSVHSLLKTCQPLVEGDSWKLKEDNTYFIFLGDYMDRGPYSIVIFPIVGNHLPIFISENRRPFML